MQKYLAQIARVTQSVKGWEPEARAPLPLMPFKEYNKDSKKYKIQIYKTNLTSWWRPFGPAWLQKYNSKILKIWKALEIQVILTPADLRYSGNFFSSRNIARMAVQGPRMAAQRDFEWQRRGPLNGNEEGPWIAEHRDLEWQREGNSHGSAAVNPKIYKSKIQKSFSIWNGIENSVVLTPVDLWYVALFVSKILSSVFLWQTVQFSAVREYCILVQVG